MSDPWRIELLGGVRVRQGDRVIPRFRQQKVGELLAHLAYDPQLHPREALTEALWPGSDPEAGRNRLRVTLHALRQELASDLETGAAETLVTADRSGVGLRAGAFSTDVAEWDALRQAAEVATEPAQARELLARAVALYGGPLLAGCELVWAARERERRAQEYLGALRRLAGAFEACGDLARALFYARQAVSVDPPREEDHYALMRLYAAAGEPGATRRQSRELERVVGEERGEAASESAQALVEALQDQARTHLVARAALRPAGKAGLPPQFTRFFGREAEMARVCELLAAHRLVTLTGPGGCGKTRLAIAVAGRLAPAFDQALGYVPLADLADARRIPEAVADALELSLSPDEEPLAQLAANLGARRSLLILDNLEHLREEGADVIGALLARIASLVCLVTSRHRLNLGLEREFPVLPLPVPEAVQLFVDRGQGVQPEFRLTEENRAAVVELCERLEGLPLAIELAAARTAVLSPAHLLEHLEQRFELLVTRHRDVPSRHRSLLAAVEESYQLLSPELQRFYRHLSVFRGGFDLEAAEWVAGDESAVDLLEQLRECSLLGVEEHGAGMRYRLLETLREYAWDRLHACGEAAAARDRHRDRFLDLAGRAAPELSRPDRKIWRDRLDGEQENLRAALRWCLESGAAEPGLRLATALLGFWEGGARLAEGREWLAALLAMPGAATDDAGRAAALYGAGVLARLQEDRAAARACWREVLSLRRRLGDKPGIAAVLAELGHLDWLAYDFAAAEAGFRQSLALWRELKDPRGIARSLCRLAELAEDQAQLPAARDRYEEALALYRAAADPQGQAMAREGLGRLLLTQGHGALARAQLEEALAIRRQQEDRWGAGVLLFQLGRVALDQSDFGAASAFWEETLAIDMEKMGRAGYVLLCLGRLALAQGDHATAGPRIEAFLEQERATGSRTGVPDALAALGDLAFLEKDEVAARARYEEALGIYRDVGTTWERLTMLYQLWRLARRLGDDAGAERLSDEHRLVHCSLSCSALLACSLGQRAAMAVVEEHLSDAASLYRQSLGVYQAMAHRRGMVACLEGLAGVAAAQAQRGSTAAWGTVARLCGAAAALRPTVGRHEWPIDRADVEAARRGAEAALGEGAFAAAWTEGQGMTLEEALADALGSAARL